MSSKNNGVNHSMKVPNKGRRLNALIRLESQLELGFKKVKNGQEEGVETLSETDIKRINKEIAILKKRT
jgi:hypothetical protein